MPARTRLAANTTVGFGFGLGLVALLLAGCTGPAAAPPAAAPVPPTSASPAPGAAASPSASASPARAAVASPSASARPSPALATPSAQPSPVAATSPASAAAAQATPLPTENPLAPETSLAGDIPDNQVFVNYTSPTGGYQLQVPEGWARTETGTDARFVSKLDGVQVSLSSTSAAPTAASAQAAQVADLQRTGRAVLVNKVQDVQLPAGPAVLVDFASNSDPDPVTGKQVRLENNVYLLYTNGKLATLTLWAPQGADNVDQWQQIAQSLRWQ